MNTIEHHLCRESAVHILLEEDALCSQSTGTWRKSLKTISSEQNTHFTQKPLLVLYLILSNQKCTFDQIGPVVKMYCNSKREEKTVKTFEGGEWIFGFSNIQKYLAFFQPFRPHLVHKTQIYNLNHDLYPKKVVQRSFATGWHQEDWTIFQWPIGLPLLSSLNQIPSWSITLHTWQIHRPKMNTIE